MSKSSGKYFFHACIIVRSLNPLYFKFAVITALWLSFLIDNHGTYRFKTTDIGNIISLHTPDSRQSKPLFHFMNCSDGSSFFTFDTLSVFIQNHLCILFCQLYQLLFRTFLRYPDIDSLLSSICKPFLYDLGIFDFFLQHDLTWDKRSSGIKLLHKAG